MFPPSFFDHFEDRLNLAVHDINTDIEMGRLSDLRDRLVSLPGVERVALHIGGGADVTMGGQTSNIKPNATEDDIRRTLNLNKIDNATRDHMSLTGLKSGAFEAKLAEMRQRIADAQNRGLAKVDAAQVQAEAKVSSAIDGVVSKIDKEVEDSLQEFATFTNGSPE